MYVLCSQFVILFLKSEEEINITFTWTLQGDEQNIFETKQCALYLWLHQIKWQTEKNQVYYQK